MYTVSTIAASSCGVVSSLGGGSLLGFFFRPPGALAHDFILKHDLHDESLVVGVTYLARYPVVRCAAPHGLGDFLQLGLVVIGVNVAGAYAHQIVVKVLEHEPAGDFKP